MLAEGELDGRLTDRMAIQQNPARPTGRLRSRQPISTTSFRTEKLFNTRQRITMPLLRRVVSQLFAKARRARGGSPKRCGACRSPLARSLLHPAVIAHFGLSLGQARASVIH